MGAEKNAITSGVASLQIKAASAFEPQALVELKSESCSHRKSLSCAVGVNPFKRERAAGEARC